MKLTLKDTTKEPLNGVLAFCGWGPMMCPANDFYITSSLCEWGVYSERELFLLDYLNRFHKDSVNISVGTNIGSLAVPLAKLGYTVFGFDAQIQMVHFAQTNIKLNKLTNIQVYNYAVGKEGEVQVPQIDLDNMRVSTNCGSIGKDNWGDKNYPLETVQSIPLDTIMEPYVKHNVILHLDVEGMEEEVLESGKNMIAKNHPIIMLEADRAEKRESLYRWLRGAGYRMFWAITPLAAINAQKHGSPMTTPGVVTINWICWHELYQPTIEGLIEVKEANLFTPIPVIKKISETFDSWPVISEYWS